MMPSYIQIRLKVSDRKEKLILKYLELTYGEKELYVDEEKIYISGVCAYCKVTKRVGWVGRVHLDLVNWFGDRNYYSLLKQWFSKKYNLEVI